MRQKEGHYMIINGPIHHEGLTIANKYVLSTRAPTYIKPMLIHLERERERERETSAQ
jgi:hypothetical protein